MRRLERGPSCLVISTAFKSDFKSWDSSLIEKGHLLFCKRYLRNRKHFPCFYRVIETRVEVWENEKCWGNTNRRRVFLQLFWVLPNFHECFYNSIETQRKCFLFLLKNNPRKITKTEHLIALFVIKMYIFYTAQFTRHKLRHHLCVSIELLGSLRSTTRQKRKRRSKLQVQSFQCHLATRESRHQPTRHQGTTSPPSHQLVAVK